VTDALTLEDSNLLHQILTMMDPEIQVLVLHCMTVKELCFLQELYRESNDINKAYPGVVLNEAGQQAHG